MKRLVIWGATGQARVLHEALGSLGFQLIAIFDRREIQSPFPNVPLLVGREAFVAWQCQQDDISDIHFSVAIGGARGSERLEMQQWLCHQGLTPLTVVHPRAFVASNATVGRGSQILAMSVVGANATLGQSVIVNTAATVDHDCVIGDGVHVGPGAHLAGEVRVGNNAFLGIGAIVLPRVHIGDGAVVGAGAVVIRNVSSGETVVGVPASRLVSS